VGCLPDLAGELKIGPDDQLDGDAEVIKRVGGREVEDLVQ